METECRCSVKMDDVVKRIKVLETHYTVQKSEETRGKWGLYALLWTNIIGWAGEILHRFLQ